MVKRATEADVGAQVKRRLTEWLDELIITRPLEESEQQHARKYLKQNCREFVVAATREGGRPVVMLDLEDGQKLPAKFALDPPLFNLLIVPDAGDRGDRL